MKVMVDVYLLVEDNKKIECEKIAHNAFTWELRYLQ